MMKISAKMKEALVLVFVALFCQILAEEMDEMREHMQECAKEFSVDDSVLKELHKGELTEADENVKCFTKCILEKSGHLDENGNVQTTKQEESHPHFAEMKMAFEKCKPDTVKNCDDAFELKKCISKELKETMKNN